MLTHALKNRSGQGGSPGAPRSPARAHVAIRNILRGASVQPKLKIGAANDPAEREADAVADRVMAMHSPIGDQGTAMPTSSLNTGPNPIRRLCTECEGGREVQRMTAGEGAEVDEEELVQSKEVPGATPVLSAASEGAIRGLGGGTPLARSERAFFEPRFGRDFSNIRIHKGAAADQSAKSIQARAYTLGSNIAFAKGEYTPSTPAGRRLLAHELTHTVQQSFSSGAPSLQRQARPAAGLPPNPPCEGRADITSQYQQFVSDIGNLIGQIPNLDAAEQARRSAFSQAVLSSEGAADIDNYTVISCTRINSPLLSMGETAGAFVDSVNRELALSQETADLMSTFRSGHDPDVLSEFLSIIAHEKRHVTLGTAVQVPSSAILPRFGSQQNLSAGYRSEEILAVAEEIATARLFQGASYIVPASKSQHIQRLWNTVRAWVTAAEFTRLRGVLITQLRDRYGSANNCDNALVVGVLKSMDLGRWRLCSTSGRLQGSAPAGLTNCAGPDYDSACGNPNP